MPKFLFVCIFILLMVLATPVHLGSVILIYLKSVQLPHYNYRLTRRYLLVNPLHVEMRLCHLEKVGL